MRAPWADFGQGQNMPTGQSDPSVMPSDRPRAGAQVWRLMMKPRIAWSAFKVSQTVGAGLEVIHDGGQFWMHYTVNSWRVALDLVVPLCVSSYRSARNEAQRARGD